MLNYGYKNITVDTFGSHDVISSCPERRTCFSILENYVKSGPSESRVCVLYGLRRSGKTELMKQCIDVLGDDKTKAMLITCQAGSDFNDVLRILDDGCNRGYDYFFIDEITYTNGFQNIGEILANSYVNIRHKKVVITGTDSLGLFLPTKNKQYDRGLFIHTTYFPYAEFCRIAKCSSIDEYIRRGCALSADLPINRFDNYDLTRDFIQTSIVDNMINSWEKQEDTDHYPKVLTEIYSADELKNAILRAINLFSGSITLKAINKEYRSGMIRSGMDQLAQDRKEPLVYKDLLDTVKTEDNIRKILGVLKNDEMSKPIDDTGRSEILSNLHSMDVFNSIPAINIIDNAVSVGSDFLEIMTHPGIFHSTIRYTLQELEKMDNWFPNATKEQRERLITKAYNEILGHLMENIIVNDIFQLLCDGDNPLLSSLDHSDKRWFVSKLTANINEKQYESDVIIIDRIYGKVYLFEVKHSSVAAIEQSHHLDSEIAQEFLMRIKDEFGPIAGRAVLYNGKTDYSFEIPRINASDFLITLYENYKDFDNPIVDTVNKLIKNERPINSLVDFKLELIPDGKTEEGYSKYSLFLTDFTEQEKECVWDVYMGVFSELAEVEEVLESYLVVVCADSKNTLKMYFDVTLRNKETNELFTDRIYHDLTVDEIKYINTYLPERDRQTIIE